MKVLLFGASGMVGKGVLLECLDDPGVEAVLSLGRRACGVTHPKLRELTRQDFFHYDDIAAELTGWDACFFCLGVSVMNLTESAYAHVTEDLTLAAARALLARNPALVFCYVSGQGTDSSGRNRLMWTRVKGRTENALLAMPFRAALMFRPGFIQPLRGVRSRTRLYNALLVAFTPLFPLLRRLFPRQICTTVSVGRAMIRAASQGGPSRVLEPPDIQALNDSQPPMEKT